MRVTQLRRPLVAAASSITRPAATPSLWHLQDVFAQLRIGMGMGVGVGATNTAVEGRRHASVKSQGAYRLRNSDTIPKKLGAKKSGDSYVITGNIIYKQRGTKWFPGENCGMGRDHTIFALACGYVKYYRDPKKHPKRQYIGVVFDKDDKLPYPQNAMRKRKLNMVAVPVKAAEPEPEVSASGIPTQVVRQGHGRKPHPRDERVIKLADDGSYAYREESWRLGTLVRTEKRKMGSRRVAMRHRRRKARAIGLEMRAMREDKIARRKESLDLQRAAKARRMRDYHKHQAEEREKKKAAAAAAAAAAAGAGAAPTNTTSPTAV
ncbi:ribosomal L27 protein-domain-containing protein [Xylariaceae sp. FL0594]|nr:ribosomal L27 protein-domain-containing protein [Xylariaceae sp. FL0594]